MSVESSRNNPLVVTVDQDTRVEAVFSRLTCGNVGDPCRIRNSPGTIQYAACCDGLVCLSDTGNEFWFPGDNEYGTCQTPPVVVRGCTDSTATNFNPDATQDDGSCRYAPTVVRGCTNPTAINFNPNATEDDGSCRFDTEETLNSFGLSLRPNIANVGTLRRTVETAPANLTRVLSSNTSDGGALYRWSSTANTIDVTLNATIANGYNFVGWEENGIIVSRQTTTTVTINAGENISLVGVFEEITPDRNNFTLRLTSNNTSWGTSAISQVSGTNVRTENTNNITRGVARTWSAASSTINTTVSARPNTGYKFVRWEIVEFILPNGQSLPGTFTSLTETFSLPANTEVEINAIFEAEIVPTVTVNCDDGNGNCVEYQVEGTDDESIEVLCSRINKTPCPTIIRGCTNRAANNYNPNATEDDGSCTFTPTWKRCSDGAEIEGDAPATYREVSDPRAGGTTCWEPIEDISFDLRDISFTYQRGSGTFPSPQNFRAENRSYGLSFRVNISTNTELFTVSPSSFVLGPRDNKQFNIGVSRNNIERFGDGVSNFSLVVETEQL